MATILPQLPAINGDPMIMLDIYTHESARNPADPPSEEFHTIDRLLALGRKVASTAAFVHFFSVRDAACYSVEEIQAHAETALQTGNILSWMNDYGLTNRIRCYPSNIRENPEVPESVFYTYVGALYIRNGHQDVQRWISALINPEHPAPVYGNGATSWTPGAQTNGPPPPPLSQPPPMPPQPQQPGGSLDHLITLQVMNQTAQQKGYTVTYPASSTGPPHNPVWTVQCCLNGQVMGEAQARAQKAAKEDAARMAYKNMKWG